jgi:hypothetical protein
MTYKAHCVVMCFRCPVIKKAVELNAVKAAQSGSEVKKVTFSFGDAYPQAVNCVIQFLYLWDYEATSAEPIWLFEQGMSQDENTNILDGPFLTLHCKVFTISHIYNIPGVGKLRIEKFQDVTQRQWKSDSLLDAAREVYSGTPPSIREMREAIVKVFWEHDGLLEKDNVKTVILEMAHLTFDILMYGKRAPPTRLFSQGGWG